MNRDLSQPTLENLSYVLRHRETWPEGFEWDYSKRSTCMLGLAEQVWLLNIDAETMLGVAGPDKTRLCFRVGVKTLAIYSDEAVRKRRDVKPEQVADEIDAYLSERVA